MGQSEPAHGAEQGTRVLFQQRVYIWRVQGVGLCCSWAGAVTHAPLSHTGSAFRRERIIIVVVKPYLAQVNVENMISIAPHAPHGLPNLQTCTGPESAKGTSSQMSRN